MVDKFEKNDELNQSFDIDSVKSDNVEIVSDEDKKEDESLIKVEAPSNVLQTKVDDLVEDLDKAMEESNVKASELSEADKVRIAYVEKLETVNYGVQYRENLLNLMNMGFFDFSSNLEMLQRNFNNLEIVCSKLFEGN